MSQQPWCSPGATEATTASSTPPESGPLSKHSISETQAALALFKAIVGPSTLFLPSGVRNAGIVAAVSISALVGAVSAYTLVLTLQTTQRLRQQGVRVRDFGDLGQAAWGRRGKAAVELAVVTTQLGFCTAYCVFVAENVQAMIFEAYGGEVAQPGTLAAECSLPDLLANPRLVYYIIMVVIPLLIPVTWVRQVRYLTPSNILATFLVVASVLYMFVAFGARLSTGPVAELEELNLFNPSKALVYFGTAAYAFEGIGVLLHIEGAMQHPQRLPSVVVKAMGAATVLQVSFACFAYVIYGDTLRSIVTVSLGHGPFLGGNLAVQLVQLAWIVEVLLTFPLQLFPVTKILEGRILPERRSGRRWTKNAIRSSLLLSCMVVALFGYSSVDNLVALIGALGCIPLAIVYPALFHWKVCYRDAGLPREATTSGHEAEFMADGLEVAPSSSVSSASGTTISSPPQSPPPGHPRTLPPISTCTAVGDVLLVAFGVGALVLAAAIAISNWVTATFQLQVCVLREEIGSGVAALSL